MDEEWTRLPPSLATECLEALDRPDTTDVSMSLGGPAPFSCVQPSNTLTLISPTLTSTHKKQMPSSQKKRGQELTFPHWSCSWRALIPPFSLSNASWATPSAAWKYNKSGCFCFVFVCRQIKNQMQKKGCGDQLPAALCCPLPSPPAALTAFSPDMATAMVIKE